MIDQFENLPGIIAELQDGGLAISNEVAGPRVLVLGTASKGPSDLKTRVSRNQESEALFGTEGSLIRGMYEARNGGAQQVYLYRINTLSAILYGVGTTDQVTNPTSIETLIKDGSAADLYFVRFEPASVLGPNATIGRLQVKNALGTLVYDNNPGGTPVDLGEVIVSGTFSGGTAIGAPGDDEDFVSMREVAQDLTEVLAEVTGETYDDTLGNTVILANSDVAAGTVTVYIGGDEVVSTAWTLDTVSEPNEIIVDAGLAPLAGAITVDYSYDAEPDMDLRDGKDGATPSLMELYEALEDAYRALESDEIDIVVPMNAFLDANNLADGDTIVLSSDETVDLGRRYPVPGSSGDALGKLYKEEYEGTVYYFWNTDGDAEAEIFPQVGLASATTKIDGTTLTADDFKEVNFAYQLANFCFRLTVNDNFCLGVIGTTMPVSNSTRDVARWIGKDPVLSDATEAVLTNGEGLLGNKFMAGTTSRTAGFYATFSSDLPTGALESNSDVIQDRGGNMIDIGKYLSIVCMPFVFFNDYDSVGTGYQANGAAMYAGLVSSLVERSSPTNKTLLGVRAPFRIFKPKLNSLAGAKYVASKEKEGLIKVADAPTAARDSSDYTRLTTVRIAAGAIDIVRQVGDPYIGEPNTRLRREALETSIRKELADYQKEGNLVRFEVKVLATPTQVIQGDMIVELTLVPAFETRKITVITSLAGL